MERFFLNLKMERVWQRDYANHAEAKIDIADYIAGFYNPCQAAFEARLSLACRA
jgi:putative transposase